MHSKIAITFLGFAIALTGLACQSQSQQKSEQASQSQGNAHGSTVLPKAQSSAEHLLGHAVQIKSPAEIINSNPDIFELFRLPTAPQILILDFSSLSQQADMLNRLAVFLEVAGFSHQQVLKEHAIKAQLIQNGREWKSVYYGHDYSASDLARFFNQLSSQGLKPNASEQFLLQLILREGLIKNDGQQYLAAEPIQSLISISENSELDALPNRDQIRLYGLAHEIRHGLYFTNAAYKQACTDFWNGLAYSQKTAFRESLARLHYDPKLEDLMINETQAFLLSNTNSFDQISLSIQELLQLKKQLLLQLPPQFLPLALEIES